MKSGRPPQNLPNIIVPTKEIKLNYIQFVKEAFVNFSLVSSFKGDITLHDSYVSFIVEDNRYLIPLSNIASAVFKKD